MVPALSRRIRVLAVAERASAWRSRYFSYHRCPRYGRLHRAARVREDARIRGLLAEAERETGSKTAWRKLATVEIARWEAERKRDAENPESLWYVTATADEVRTMLKDEAKRDGYAHALVIVNGKQTLTVGQSIPMEGEASAHYTVFVGEYEDAHFASMVDAAQGAGHEGEDGVNAVRTVNDVCAIIIYELAKVVLKRLTACALLDRALAGHLCLHAEASSKLDEMRRAFIQLERHTHAYKLALDILKERIACIVKNALGAQRSGALTLEEYARSNAGDDPAALAAAVDAAPGNEEHYRKGEGAGAPVLTEDERDQGAEIFNGEVVKPMVGSDLVRALTTSLGPHNIDVARILGAHGQQSEGQALDTARRLAALSNTPMPDPVPDPVPELEPDAVSGEILPVESISSSDQPHPAAELSDEEIERQLTQWFRSKEAPKATTTQSAQSALIVHEDSPEAREKRQTLENHLRDTMGLDPAIAKERARQHHAHKVY